MPLVLHNVHRNLAAPNWFTGAMAVTNSFVHEINVSRWLLGSEMVAAQVFPAGETGLLMIIMRTEKGEIVSTEVNINGGYGYHVHAQLVGVKGTMRWRLPLAQSPMVRAPRALPSRQTGFHALRRPTATRCRPG